MKILKVIFILFISMGFLAGCQKELTFESNGISAGTFKKDAAGGCLPVYVNSNFYVGTLLTNLDYVDVQVDVTVAGDFDIRSDTINGYSFSRTGTTYPGTNTIRLYPTGTPIAGGLNTFTITYGTSTCTFDINVIGAGTGLAVYTLGGSPGSCTGFISSGVYTAGNVLSAANKVTFNVNVSATGTYSISTNTVNGMTFSANGVFTTTGNQTITLAGTGTPAVAGNFNFTPSGGSNTCTFTITVLSAVVATYTLGGNPGNCTGVVLAGTYAATISTSNANTATVDVNVTAAGSYSLTTTTVNGIKFSGTGVFTATGTQSVILTANTAVPPASGTFNYPITGAAGTTCTFPVTYLPAPPPAVFTLSGSPGTCNPATVNGTYTASSPLNASNNIVVEVNVSSVGSYTLSTNTVNGMTFTTSGIFTATGLQNVTLVPTAGSTPTAAGTSTLTPQAGASMCTFNIVVNTAPTGIFTCDIDGVHTVFNFDAHASVTYFVFGTNETDLVIEGRLLPVGQPTDAYHLYVSKPNGGNIPAMLYDENTFVNTFGTYKVGMDYFIDATSTYWSVSDNTPFSPNPHFVINITTLSATNCIGTFFGTIKENFGSGPGTKVITNGVFNVPVQ